jgi:hypothetical protein
VASIALWAALLPGPAVAQTCFRGRPTPECRWFWITESGARWPLTHPSASDARHEFLWSFGVMKNVGRRSAAGMAFQFSTDYAEEGTYRLSLKPRYRLWLSPIALDLSAGPVLLGSGDRPFGLHGVSAHAALNYRDVVALTAGVDTHRRNLTGRTADASVGFRFGSFPGVVFGIVTPLVLLARAVGSGSY